MIETFSFRVNFFLSFVMAMIISFLKLLERADIPWWGVSLLFIPSGFIFVVRYLGK